MQPIQLFAVQQTGPIALPVPPQAQTIHDPVEGLPTAVYTALRTFEHNQFLHLSDHLDRLEYSLAALGCSYNLDRLRLRQALHQVCSAYPWPDARIRLDVLADTALNLGCASRELITLAPFEPIPPALYEQGVRVGITQDLSREQPLVKKADFVQQRRRCFEADPGLYECLLVDADGRILEGTTSNFFAVRDGVLLTAGQGMLEGVARKIVLRVAAELQVPVRFTAVNRSALAQVDEAALSSSSRAIIPIVQIDGTTIGSGLPGPVTEKLLAAYQAYVARAIRPAIVLEPGER